MKISNPKLNIRFVCSNYNERKKGFAFYKDCFGCNLIYFVKVFFKNVKHYFDHINMYIVEGT